MTTLAVRFLSLLLRIIPFSQLGITTKLLGILLRGYRRDIIDQNLLRAFPGQDPNSLHEVRVAYRKHLSNVIAESLKAHSMEQMDLAKRFVFNNPELANQYHADGQSIILCLGHIGNWEWGQAIVSHYLDAQCVGVYKELSNKSFDKYILQQRSKFNVELLSQKEILKHIIRHKDGVYVYIFIADQFPPSEPRMKVKFLNTTTYFDQSIEKIAKKYDLPVIYADIKAKPDHKYETDLIQISGDPSSTEDGMITTSYASLLEQSIRRQPELWLWSHRRWKDS